MAVSANRRKITFLRNETAATGFVAAKAAIEAVKADIENGEIAIATYTEGEAKKSLLAVKNLDGFTYITESSDEIAALVARAKELEATHAKGVGKALATVAEEITAAVAKLKKSNNISEAVKGVTVQVDEANGIVAKPVVTIAEGTLTGAATDANLVTGAAVKTYVEGEITKVNASASGLTDRVGILESKHAKDKTVAEEVTAGITNIDEVSKTAGTDVTVTVTTKSGGVTGVTVNSSALKSAITDGDAATLKSAKTYADEQIKASVASVYKVKGTKATYEALPSEDNVEGDVWNVTAAHGNTPAGTNYVWVAAVEGGEAGHWDPLGGTIDLSPYETKTNASTTYATKTELSNEKAALLGTEGSTGDTIYGAKKDVVEAKVIIDKYTVNGKPISGDPTLAGADILVGGKTANATKEVSTAIEELYTQAGNVSGDIDKKIDTAIKTLDADVANTAAASGEAASTQIKVSISEVDGKLTGVTVTAPSFESAGAAATVKTELLGVANKPGNTIISAKEDAKAASDKVDTTISGLTVTNNVSEAVKGVTVQVNEANGIVAKPVVTIAEGTLTGAATDANLVTGAAVKKYVEGLTGAKNIVTAIGGQHGAFTFTAAGTSNSVNLSVSGDNVISATLTDIDCGTF